MENSVAVQLEQIIISKWEAYNRRDLDAMMSALATDVEVDVASMMQFHSRADYRAHNEREVQSFSDAQLTDMKVISSGNIVVLEGIWNATMTDSVTMPNGASMEATNQTTHLKCAIIYEFKDDQIVAIRNYWNSMVAMMELGMMPPI